MSVLRIYSIKFAMDHRIWDFDSLQSTVMRIEIASVLIGYIQGYVGITEDEPFEGGGEFQHILLFQIRATKTMLTVVKILSHVDL